MARARLVNAAWWLSKPVGQSRPSAVVIATAGSNRHLHSKAVRMLRWKLLVVAFYVRKPEYVPDHQAT